MTQQVLALKWRPRTFNEVIGQPHVVKALSNGLDNNRLHHAFLFTGTRGVGKTTLARIFAKSLNCEQGVSSHPCGECSICKEVDSGRFVDLIEIDAASRTRVEDTREILDNVQYAPTRGRYKIYLIDEVHMLSNSSFNALLKTLEEPPEHVKFLLATTDPQKLPVTVLSRCLRFQLKRISDQDITQQLAHILETEKIPFELEALKLIAHAGDGSMRDSLSLLDQAIAYSGQNITYAQTHEMLGLIDTQHLEHLLEALASKDAQNVIETLKNIQSNGIDYPRFLEELIDAFHRLTMLQLTPDFAEGESISFQKLATLFTAEDLQLFYQIALNGRKDLQNHPNTAVGFEMTLLRMVLFAPTAPLSLGSDNNSTPRVASISSSSSQTLEAVSNSEGLRESVFEKKSDVKPLEIEISSIEPEPELKLEEEYPQDISTQNLLNRSELPSNRVVDNSEQVFNTENSAVSVMSPEVAKHDELVANPLSDTDVPWVVDDEISNADEILETAAVESHITDDLGTKVDDFVVEEFPNQLQKNDSITISQEDLSITSETSQNDDLDGDYNNDVISEVAVIVEESVVNDSHGLHTHNENSEHRSDLSSTVLEQEEQSPLGSDFISSLTDLIENPEKVENHSAEMQTDTDRGIATLPDYLLDRDMPVSNNENEYAISQELPNTNISTTQIPSNTGLTSLTNNEEWLALVSSLSLESVLSGIAHSLVFKSYDDHQLVLERPLSVQDFRIDEAETRLAMAISAKLKTKVHCRIEYVEELSDESLHDRTERLDEERQEEAAQAFRNDEVVQYLENSFGAVLLEKTLKPREG